MGNHQITPEHSSTSMITSQPLILSCLTPITLESHSHSHSPKTSKYTIRQLLSSSRLRRRCKRGPLSSISRLWGLQMLLCGVSNNSRMNSLFRISKIFEISISFNNSSLNGRTKDLQCLRSKSLSPLLILTLSPHKTCSPKRTQPMITQILVVVVLKFKSSPNRVEPLLSIPNYSVNSLNSEE
jgi:hypothetical protein